MTIASGASIDTVIVGAGSKLILEGGVTVAHRVPDGGELQSNGALNVTFVWTGGSLTRVGTTTVVAGATATPGDVDPSANALNLSQDLVLAGSGTDRHSDIDPGRPQ